MLPCPIQVNNSLLPTRVFTIYQIKTVVFRMILICDVVFGLVYMMDFILALSRSPAEVVVRKARSQLCWLATWPSAL